MQFLSSHQASVDGQFFTRRPSGPLAVVQQRYLPQVPHGRGHERTHRRGQLTLEIVSKPLGKPREARRILGETW